MAKSKRKQTKQQAMEITRKLRHMKNYGSIVDTSCEEHESSVYENPSQSIPSHDEGKLSDSEAIMEVEGTEPECLINPDENRNHSPVRTQLSTPKSTPTAKQYRRTSKSVNTRRKLFGWSPQKLLLNTDCPRKSYGRSLNDSKDFPDERSTSLTETTATPEGRRFFTIHSLNSFTEKIIDHVRDCVCASLRVTKEVRMGFKSTFTSTCSTCSKPITFSNDAGNSSLHVNEAAAWAANVTGSGYESLKHSLTVFDVPSPCFPTFSKYEQIFASELKEAFESELKRNGEEERKLAIDLGQVDSDGIAWTDVYGDGQWSKRSYNQQGTALSGSAVLIGMLTMKPLFVNVRNKTCFICKTMKNETTHDCFKNWDGSSSGMEANIIQEGFQKSIVMHNLRYKRFIGDGDSSVFSAIRDVYLTDANYWTSVEKVECYLHAIRAMNRSLLNAQKSSNKHSGYPKSHRDCLQDRIHLFGKYANYIIDIHIENRPVTNSQTLAKDLKAMASHIFGIHIHCSDFMCVEGNIVKPSKGYNTASTSNLVTQETEIQLEQAENCIAENQPCSSASTFYVKNACSKRTPATSTPSSETDVSEESKQRPIPSDFFVGKLWKDITDILDRLSVMSTSLIYKLNTNMAETFQSHINKFSGGRRANVVMRGGYNRKVQEATFSYMYGPTWYVNFYEKIRMDPPSSIWNERRCAHSKVKTHRRNRKKNSKRKRAVLGPSKLPPYFSKCRKPEGDRDYGVNAIRDDMDENLLLFRLEQLLSEKGVRTREEQWQVHLETVGQHSNPEYTARRNGMITASVAGELFGLQDSTSNVSTLDKLLEPADLSKIPAIAWGTRNEAKARQLYSKQTGMEVQDAGLFVCLEFGGLGASPDGLIEEDGIIEIKCPYIERKRLPSSVADRKKNVYLSKKTADGNETYLLRKTSHYYKQVVMQLHITNRKYCDFVVWTQGSSQTTNLHEEMPLRPDGHLLIIRVHKDNETQLLWEKMRDKFARFFMQDLGPELVDPRFPRNMGYRQPPYRLKAIQSCNLKKQQRNENKVQIHDT